MARSLLLPAALAVFAVPATAQDPGRENLGVFANWAAFRDASPSRCYAIAKPRRAGDETAYASIATYPQRGIRGQVHLRLARAAASGSTPVLRIAGRRFELAASGRDAWAKDSAMDAAIIAAMRGGTGFRVTARSARGRLFTSRYDLSGAATAIDAALVGCAEVR